MNPFFWILALIGMVAVWFVLRKLFIKIGNRAVNLMQDTKNILNSEDAVEENSENESRGNENA